jgi:hypothetical protein
VGDPETPSTGGEPGIVTVAPAIGTRSSTKPASAYARCLSNGISAEGVY